MIAHFGAIEADFAREYRINLAEAVWWMPWRRFLVLLRDLSPDATWVRLARSKLKPGVRRITNPETAEAWFKGLGR